MPAKKPSRFAGLVFVLAVVFGGVSFGAVVTDDATSSIATVLNTAQYDWL